MWREYEDPEGKVGVISIALGHAKAKRGDKNPLKISLGVADRAILDARVLSGSMDDKTYINNDNAVQDADALLLAPVWTAASSIMRQTAPPLPKTICVKPTKPAAFS